MSEDQIKVMQGEMDRLREQLAASDAEKRAIAEAARNIGDELAHWKAYALRMQSDPTCAI